MCSSDLPIDFYIDSHNVNPLFKFMYQRFNPFITVSYTHLDVYKRQTIPDFNLKASVKNLRPHDLHLSDKYENASISLGLTADFTGKSIDDMKMCIRDRASFTILADSRRAAYSCLV